jgi:2-polyprenyl-6-methoxyphenol hydroxylase-like FAD-dependent oxidoreductase
MLPEFTEVLIVGAGPTALVLANQLARKEVPFVIIDRLGQHENTSRAAVVHARTLEVLEELDISQRLIARGVKVPRFTVRDRDRVLLTIDFGGLPTKYPYTLMVPQNEIEDVLESRLRELGGEVLRGTEACDIDQHASDVSVTVRMPGGDVKQLRAKYVVGADGMHSIVREMANIGFRGGTYAQSFILADVIMDWDLGPHEVMLFFSPEGLVVVAPLPHGHHRIVATVDEAPEHPSLEDVQKILDERGPKSRRALTKSMVWSSRFRVHHRVADKYFNGRLAIAGDAAHVHSPAGGQGMNTGIQDASLLGKILAAPSRMDHVPFDRYQRSRRPVAEDVVALTDRLTRIATMKGHLRRWARNGAIRALDHVPAFKRRLGMQLAELDHE